MKPILAAAAAVVAFSCAGAPAHAQGFRELMEDIGIQKKKQERVDYSERAPLVLPPSAEALPPPEDGQALAKANPQWPTDPDQLKAREDADDKTPNYLKSKYNEHPAQDIYKIRAEEQGRTFTRSAKEYETTFDRNAVLSPEQLKEVRNRRAKEAAAAGPVVMVEPDRARLTDPPPGYRVPSPNQPFGPGEEEKKKKGFLSKLNPFD